MIGELPGVDFAAETEGNYVVRLNVRFTSGRQQCGVVEQGDGVTIVRSLVPVPAVAI